VYSGKLRDFQPPGTYGLVGGQWACHPPRGTIGMLVNHTITEHEDGTITVSPSILFSSTDPARDWHGYLERGVWREV
jgi:hypothetical protein